MNLTNQIRGSGRKACPACGVLGEPIDVRGQSRFWVLATYLCTACRNVHQYPWPRAEAGVGDGQLEVIDQPVPQVVESQASTAQLPRTVTTLLTLAEQVGWVAGARVARVVTVDRLGHAGKVVDSVVLRAVDRRGGGLFAIWRDRKFHLAWTWTATEEPAKRGAKDLAAWLQARRPAQDVAA